MMRKRLLFTSGLLLVSMLLSHAERLINVDFGAHTNPAFSVKTGRAATGLTDTDYWNLYSRDGAGGSFLSESHLLNLKLSDGSTTDADLFVTNAPGAWFTLNPDPMFESYLYPGNPNIDMHLVNVPTAVYDIYIYAHGQPAQENSVLEVIAGGVTYPAKATSTAANWDALGWREDQQYVVFRNVPVSSSERLIILSKPGAAGMAVINGIQLLQVGAGGNTEIIVHRQPSHQTITIGQTAEFSIGASSSLPLTYEWTLNGTVITGANDSTLRIENVTEAHAGQYKVRVRNGQTTISSESASLQVYRSVSEPLLNIDFGAHLNPFFTRKSGPAAIGHGGSDQWNLYSRDASDGSWLNDNQLPNLFWHNGSPSTIHLAVTNASGAWYTLNKDPMFESYLYPGGRQGNIGATLRDLPAATYDVYVYAHGQIPSENGVIELSTDSFAHGTKATSAAANWDSSGWTEDNHYVLFQNVTVQNGERLRITAKPGESGLSVINGLQLRRKQASTGNDAIIISQQPTSANVPVGGSFQLSVSATSERPVTYQWSLNGNAITGATSPALSIQNVSHTDAGSYVVAVSNGQRTVASAPAMVQVFVPIQDPLLNIDFGAHLNPFLRAKTGPAAIGRNVSDAWNLYSRDGANGDWLDNNSLTDLLWSDGTASNVRLSVANASGAWYTLNRDPMFESYLYPGSRAGDISATLTQLPAGKYDVYVYAHGQIPSENGVIELSTLSANYGLKVLSTDESWDRPAWTEGNHFVVFRDVTIQSGEHLRIHSKPGQSGLSVINGLQLRQTSIVSDGGGIVIQRQPQDVVVAIGDDAELSVAAVDDQPLRFQWSFHGNPIAGGTNATLRIVSSEPADAGAYRVTISDAQASVTSASATVQVFERTADPVLNVDFGAHLNPYFRTKTGPAAIGLNNNDRWNLYSRDGAGGQFLNNNQLTNLVWSDGSASTIHLGVTNAAGAWYTLNRDPMFESYLYPISRVGRIGAQFTGLPGGIYDVYVYAHGQIPSENAAVQVGTDSLQHGTRVTSALSGWDSPAWTEGNHFVLFRDVAVGNGERLRITVSPGQGRFAVINGVQLRRKAQVPNGPEIVILQQPQNAVVPLGGTNEFSILASSGLPLRYQWSFNGNVLSGETNATLRIQNVQPRHAGSYRVTLSNGERTMASNVAQLETYMMAARPILNVDFGAHENPRFRSKTGPAAIGNGAEDRWNLYSRDDGRGGWLANNQLSNLAWHDGTASEIQLSVSNAAGAWFTLNEDPMFESYLYPLSRSGFIDALLTKLPAGRYDVYVYAHGQIPEENAVIELSTSATNFGSKATSAAQDWDGPGWTEDDEYVVFQNVRVGAGEALSLTAKPGSSDIALINGVQLVLREGEPAEFRETVADWTFEDQEPGDRTGFANDSSGNGHHVTQVVGTGAQFVASHPRMEGSVSVLFPPGSGGFGAALRPQDTLDFNLGSEFTLEVSVQPGSQNAEHNRGVVVGQDAATGRLVYGIDYRSENRAIHFLVVDAQGQGDWVEAILPDDGKSHHVAGVFRNGALSIYLDKQLAQTKTTGLVPGLTPGGAGRVTLGANDIGGYWFNGVLDRVRISRRALPVSDFFEHEGEVPSPLVILQPLQNLTVTQGDSATFRVVAAGAPAFTYRWSFDGQTLSNQVTDTLVLNNVRPADAGEYRVTVASGPWEISSSARLIVTGIGTNAPVISAHPESRVAAVGGSAQFSVTATGELPLGYQWIFNGTAIAGATNDTLSLGGLTLAQAGTYYVVVNNSSGVAVSRAAVLNVSSSEVNGGLIYFSNRSFDVDAPVTDDRGLRVTGPEFLAQLWGAAPGQPLAPVGAAIPFGTAENAGYFSDIVSRVIPGILPGQVAQVEVRGWDPRAGTTYEQAAENGGLHGAQALSVILGGGNLPPASLLGMQPFSLVARPRITQQPADASVADGRVAVFQVVAAGTAPFTYQWKFNNAALTGENRSSLVLSNVTALQAGNYSVDVRNRAGSVTSTQAALTVTPRDTQAPLVTITSPAAGTSTAPRITLSGTATDNTGVTRVEWSRNGQIIGPAAFSNGAFSVTNVALSSGTNVLAVTAYDAEGNSSAAIVAVVLESTRTLWLGAPIPGVVYEGARLSIPLMVSSDGDIGALSFTLSYPTNLFTDASLEWTHQATTAFHQVNTNSAGAVRATYVLPGQTIRAGTNRLALLHLRARSVPETLTAPIHIAVDGIFSTSGDAINSGTLVLAGEVRVLQRRVLGDNNGNHRLDIGDASAIIRWVTGLDPLNSQDVTGNDLNRNDALDAGDILRVLRVVVGLDPQPAGLQAQALRAAATEGRFVLTSPATRLVPGDPVRVVVSLSGNDLPVSGASFALSYPTNALLLESASALGADSIVPLNALTLWNTGVQGTASFAGSAGLPWDANNGVVAELTFRVQPGAADQRAWTLRVSNGEAASGTDVAALGGSELSFAGREAQPTVLTAAFNSTTGQIELRIAVEPGAYKVEASEDLRTWTEIRSIGSFGGNIFVTDTPPANATRRFYRAQQVD